MSWLGFAGDEELGKKNDDHRPVNGAAASTSWSARKTTPSFRKRRIIYCICALLFIYVFVKNIPTDLGPSPRFAHGPNNDHGGKLPPVSSDPPSKKPRKPATPSEAEEHYHDGPIKFYLLASSLHSVARLGGQHEFNKNVLFAASNLKSASEVIPLACEMARWDRNDVHFAIMGRDDMEIQEIKKLNGAEEDCNIHWHGKAGSLLPKSISLYKAIDARPDYSHWSSDFRMEVSVAASLEHIQTFIHPQVILVDDPSREDAFFTTAMRSKAMDIGKPVIELPIYATENMMWITRLDSESLSGLSLCTISTDPSTDCSLAWTRTYVDILVQAPPGASGSLVRMLKSIENADYFGARRPHLTIELPTDIEPSTWRYLDNLIWPPLDWSGAPHVSQVSLRHRIPRRTSTEHEASARLAESFYPVRSEDSHVLLLSPQVELSPLYYHYLLYNLLEYRYSAHAKASKEAPNLIGFSLERPSYYLNDTTPLAPPVMKKPSAARKSDQPAERTPFLWQAPSNNAVLYFGDKWMEFHSFLTARLSKPPSARRKVFSEKHPSWLEFFLELMRNRGYSLLYPNFLVDEDSIVTIHDELYQNPEEYPEKGTKPDSSVPDLDPDAPLTKEYDMNDRKAPPDTERALLSSNLVSLLPNSGDLPELSDLPLLSYNGISISRELSHEAAMAFSTTYRRDIGQCRADSETTPREPSSALDLFCRRDEVYDPLALPELPQNPPPPQQKPHAEGEILPEQLENAKQEASAHVARQEGKHKPAQQRAPRVRPEHIVQQDNSKETQNEFQLQLERQAKQAGSGANSGSPKDEKATLEKDEPRKDELETNVPTRGEPEKGKHKHAELKEDPVKPASPNHSGFHKQDPKNVAEDVKEDSTQEKGAGW